MTYEMKAFLADLADLMEDHHITEMSIEENTSGWSSTVKGIEFTMASQIDKGGNYHSVEFYTMPGCYNDVKTIRDDVEGDGLHPFPLI